MGDKRLGVKSSRSGSEKKRRFTPLSARAGERLRDIRKEAGLTQVQLAEKMIPAGSTATELMNEQSRITRLELGKTEFTLDALARFAKVLDRPISDFVPELNGGGLTPDEGELLDAYRLGGPSGILAVLAGRLKAPR